MIEIEELIDLVPYTINEYDLKEISRHGWGSISCRVHGYWSSDSISLVINRNVKYTDGDLTFTWRISLNHSSGGRDPEVVEQDTDASVNFAAGLVAMATLGKKLMSGETVQCMELWHQEHIQEMKAQEAADNIIRKERYNADTAYGYFRATDLLEGWHHHTAYWAKFRAYERGTDTVVTFKVGKKINKTYWVSGQRVSKENFLVKLAGCSNRIIVG
jgi:hypothetical protein